MLPQRGVGITSGGVAGMHGTFILVLAYTDWLEMSRRQTVIRELQAVACVPGGRGQTADCTPELRQ
jgi:hypothetical protein